MIMEFLKILKRYLSIHLIYDLIINQINFIHHYHFHYKFLMIHYFINFNLLLVNFLIYPIIQYYQDQLNQ